MARIPLVDVSDPSADPEARRLIEGYRARTDYALPQDRNVLRAVANHPPLLEAMLSISTAVQDLTPAQRELAYLTAAVTNDCFY